METDALNVSCDKYIIEPQTVTNSGTDQEAPVMIRGTVGYEGNVKYSEAGTATIRETYVVSNKK